MSTRILRSSRWCEHRRQVCSATLAAAAVSLLIHTNPIHGASTTPIFENWGPNQNVVLASGPGDPGPNANPAPPPTPAQVAPPPANSQPTVSAPTPPTQVIPTVNDGQMIDVSRFEVGYTMNIAGLPTPAELSAAPITLGKHGGGFMVATETMANGRSMPRPGVEVIQTTLAQLSSNKPQTYYASAINSIEEQLVEYLNSRGWVGIYVTLSTGQFNGSTDIRALNDSSLDLIVHVTVVGRVRTVASGDGFSAQGPDVKNAQLDRIKAQSPIQPATQPFAAGPESVLNKTVLDNYIYQLDRQPGRQVSAEISPSAVPGEVNLDYLVNEDKPWTAFFQLSNTGTEETNPWRERFGFVDNQLTGNDDIFSINYNTAGFTQENEVDVSYSIPLIQPDKLRFRVYGGYDSFAASDVGLAGEIFNGETSDVGGEFILNIYQHNRFFVDAVAGTKYQHIFVDNVTLAQSGSADLINPYIGLHAERYTPTNQFSGDITALGNFTGASQQSLDTLGRADVTPNWVIMQGDAAEAFYLEPILDPDGFAAGTSTLANQIVLSVQGQEAFNQRLIPEEEAVAGGLYTVRGYPESATAGDSVGIASFEYRLHVPSLFAVNPNPPMLFGAPFRVAPQEPYGQPDWDFIVKYFLDAAQVVNSEPESYEQNSTLVGTGLGAELDIKRNVSLAFDWGVALHGIGSAAEGDQVTAGSSQFNFVFTFSY
jgi:hemolysin activation/secretion protein